MNVKITSNNHLSRDKASAVAVASSSSISARRSKSRKNIHDDDDNEHDSGTHHSPTVITKSKNKKTSGRKAQDSSLRKTESEVRADHNYFSSGEEDKEEVNHRLSLLAKRRETMAPSSSPQQTIRSRQRQSCSEYENDLTYNDMPVDPSPMHDKEPPKKSNKKINQGRSQQQKGSHKMVGHASTQNTSSRSPIAANAIGSRQTQEEDERRTNTNVLSAVDYARSGTVPKSAVGLGNKQNPYRNLQRIPLNPPVPKTRDVNKSDGDTEGEGEEEEEGGRDAAGSTTPSLQLPSFDVPESVLLSRRLKEKVEAILQQEPSLLLNNNNNNAPPSSQAFSSSPLPVSVISKEEGGLKLPPLMITTLQRQPSATAALLMTPLWTGATMSASPSAVASPLPSFGGVVSTTPKSNNSSSNNKNDINNNNNNNTGYNRPLSSGLGSVANGGTLFVQNIIKAKVRKSEDFTVRYHESLPRIGGIYETKATIDALIEPVPLMTLGRGENNGQSGAHKTKTNSDRIVDAVEIARKLRHRLSLQKSSHGQVETGEGVREGVVEENETVADEVEGIQTEQQQRNGHRATASAAAIHPCIIVADKATVNKLRIDSKIQRASKMNFTLHNNNNEIRSHIKEETRMPSSAAQEAKSSWGTSPSTHTLLPPVIIGGTNTIKLEHFLTLPKSKEVQSVSGHKLYPFAIRRRRLLPSRRGNDDDENESSQAVQSDSSNCTGGIEGQILVGEGGGKYSYEQDEKEGEEEDEEDEEGEETSEANRLVPHHSAEAFYRFNSTQQQQQRKGMSSLAEVKALSDAQHLHRLAFVSTLKNARRMEIVTGVRKGGLPHQFLAHNAALSQSERAIVDAKSSVAMTHQTETENGQEPDLSGLLGLGGAPKDKTNKSKKNKKTTIFRKIMVFSEDDGSIRSTMVAVGEGERIITENTESRNSKRNSTCMRRSNSSRRSIRTSINNDSDSEGWEDEMNDELLRNKRERKRASTLVDAIAANANGAYASHLQRNARNNHSDPIAPTPAAQLKSAYAPVRHMRIIRVDIAVDVRAEEETFATLVRLYGALKAEAAKSLLMSPSSATSSSPLSFSPEREDLIGKIREALNPEHLMSELSRDRLLDAAGLGVDEARRSADGVLLPQHSDGRSTSHPMALKSLISLDVSPPTSVYRNVNGVPTQQGARLEDFIRRREKRANIFECMATDDDKNYNNDPDDEGNDRRGGTESDPVRFEPPSEVEQYLHEKLTIPQASQLPYQSSSGNRIPKDVVGSVEASRGGGKQHKRLSSSSSPRTRTSTITPLPSPQPQSSATRGKRKDSVLPFEKQISHQRGDSSAPPFPFDEKTRNGVVATSSSANVNNANNNKTTSSSENNNRSLYARRCCFICLSAPSNSVPEETVNRSHAALLLALNTTRNPIKTRIISAIDCSSIIPELLSAIEQDKEMRESRLDELAWESHRWQNQNASVQLNRVAQKRTKKAKCENYSERALFSAQAGGGEDGAFGANSLIEASTLETMRGLSKATAVSSSSLHPSRSSPFGRGGVTLLSNKGNNNATPPPSLALSESSYRGPKSGENSDEAGGISTEGGAWDTLEEDERRHRLLDLTSFAVIDVLARQTEVLRLGFIQRQEKESPRKSNGDRRGEELLPCYIIVELNNAVFASHNVGVASRNSDIAVTNSSVTKTIYEESTALGPNNLIGERGSGKEGYVHDLSSQQQQEQQCGLVTLSNSLTMTTANRATTRLSAVGIMGDTNNNNNNNNNRTTIPSNAPLARSGNVSDAAASPTAIAAAAKSYFGAVESQRLQRRLEMLRQPEPDVAFEVIPPFQNNNNSEMK